VAVAKLPIILFETPVAEKVTVPLELIPYSEEAPAPAKLFMILDEIVVAGKVMLLKLIP